MKIPKTLKVGGHIYEVRMTKPKDKERHRGNWGRTFIEEKQILLDKELPQSQLEETFLHETLHCCFHQAGLGYDIDDKVQITEEQIITRITPILHEVLKNNKLLK